MIAAHDADAGYVLVPTENLVAALAAGQHLRSRRHGWTEGRRDARGHHKPEAVYFSNKGNGRSGIMIVSAEDASQFPHVAETLFLNFDATVNWHIAMLPRS